MVGQKQKWSNLGFLFTYLDCSVFAISWVSLILFVFYYVCYLFSIEILIAHDCLEFEGLVNFRNEILIIQNK
jgi:hypothetical protein